MTSNVRQPVIPEDIRRVSDLLFQAGKFYSWSSSQFTRDSSAYPDWYGEWLNSYIILGVELHYIGKNGDESLIFISSEDCETETNDMCPGTDLSPKGWAAIAWCANKSGNSYFMNRQGRIGHFDHEYTGNYYDMIDKGLMDSWPNLVSLPRCLTSRLKGAK